MIFEKYRDDIEAELKSIVTTRSSPFYSMMQYHLGWVDIQGNPQKHNTGKLLRPTVCLLACEALGGNWKAALPAAAVLELVHNFSLIHDDIEDRSIYRRHRATVWHIWGEPHAINVGDGMYALSQLALLRLIKNGISHEKVLRIIGLLDDACLQLCEGQFLDISYEQRTDITIKDYTNMIKLKTAALLSTSFTIGAMLGTDSDAVIEDFSNFGLSLGIAFQIKDDLLGIWGEEKTTGKSESDIYQRKKSFPIVYALGVAPLEEKEKLISIYKKQIIDKKDVAEVTMIIDRLNSHDHTSEIAKRYHQHAITILERMDLSLHNKELLKNLAVFLIERDY